MDLILMSSPVPKTRFVVEEDFVLCLAIILADSDEDEVIISAGIVKGEGRFGRFVFVRVDSEPFSLIEVEAAFCRDFRGGNAEARAYF